MKAIAVNKNKSQIGGDQMVRQEMAAFEVTVKLTGLELAFIRLVTGKVWGTQASIRREADAIYIEARQILKENNLLCEYEDLRRIMKVNEPSSCWTCQDFPERTA